MSTSATDTSKVNAANCNIRESALTCKCRPCDAANAPKPACVTTTALGVPLEPDAGDVDLLLEHVARLGAREFVVVTRSAHLYPAQRDAVAFPESAGA